MRDIEARRLAKASGDPASRRAPALAIRPCGRGRIERHDQVALERFDWLDVGRGAAAGVGVGSDIGMEPGALEQGLSSSRRQGLDANLLRVVGRREGQLVTGSGGSGPEQADNEKDERMPWMRPSMELRTPHEREKGEGRRKPPP